MSFTKGDLLRGMENAIEMLCDTENQPHQFVGESEKLIREVYGYSYE